MSTVGSVIIAFGAGTAGYFAGSKAVKDDAGSFTSLFGGIGGNIAGMFAGIGAGLSAGALIEGLKSAGEEVVNLAHDADKLSVSTEELSRLRFAAKQTGVDAESLSHAMLKLQEETGKAAKEGGEGAAKFALFGLNAKQLANESPAQEFQDIASKIAAIHNPAERAAAEVALFGKSGAELKPLLEQGATGLAAMSAEADRLGVTVSSVDAESTLRASQAVDKVSQAVTGVGEHIAAGLAPYIEDAANRMVAWAESGNHMGQIVNGALTTISYGAAFVVDVFKLVQGGIELAAGIGATSMIPLALAIDGVSHAGAWMIEHVFGKHIDTSGIDGMSDDLVKQAKRMSNEGANTIGDVFSGKTAAHVFEYFDNVQAKAHQTSVEAVKAHTQIAGSFDIPEASENVKKVTSTIAEMHKAVDEFGLSEGAKKLVELKLLGATDAQQHEATILADQLDKLKQQADVTKELAKLKMDARQAGMDEAAKKVDDLKAMGATADQVTQAQQLQKQIEQTNAAKEAARRLDEEAKKAIEQSLTPLQKEQAEVAKLQQLYDTGRLSKEQFAQARAKAESELHGEAHYTQAAVTRGSQEAFNLMNQINNRDRGKNNIEAIAQKQLAAAEKVPSLLNKVIDKLGKEASLALASIGA